MIQDGVDIALDVSIHVLVGVGSVLDCFCLCLLGGDQCAVGTNSKGGGVGKIVPI